MQGLVQGRSVIVTGASKGIGRGIARVFAQGGAKVLLVARDGRAAAEVAAELAQAGAVASAFAADVSDEEQVKAMVDAAVERHGGLDVLCANAGIFPAARLETMSLAEWREVMRVNLEGCFLSVRACIPALARSGAGRVILTSSITGPITGFPGWSHYAASKAGQLGFMRTAALELARKGITVNAILPGNIATEGLADLGQDYVDSMIAAIPLKRLGSVEDIGHAAAFLASKEAGFITGQTLVVDGGQTLPESLAALSD
ncbi:3-oxoacyl-ACP reductase FabG [Polyangium jinanense]|uniref:3-oxoacyl-ACP reductase FabG n=1 Tax=Polyangium jinanense TaxID=2829994 RepID=A0A9X4AWG4_9BACT|nr:3-oxoacyl-ACP reductase FabG [Polyangium jinanense]MDC3960461.1 3-oxoacyl-ACP reductase FabG [Polyangium jinanense]MDC3986766.1 3-oxoacyl-ACP reductase FabG [Polyangium jinanense]